jgi:nudix-type nucleoside diphosphatase (YffH/AdpP family)
MTDKRVEIDDTEVVFDDFFKIDKTTLRFERFDGSMSNTVKRLCFVRGDSVAALIFNRDTAKILLTNQFRAPTYRNGDGWITEVLAGSVEKGEPFEEALRREILEEVGYRVGDLTHIYTFYVSPGGTSERIALYYAEVGDGDKIAPGGGAAAEDEDIEILQYTLPEAWQLLDSGQINDAKTLIALMWLRSRKEH